MPTIEELKAAKAAAQEMMTKFYTLAPALAAAAVRAAEQARLQARVPHTSSQGVWSTDFGAAPKDVDVLFMLVDHLGKAREYRIGTIKQLANGKIKTYGHGAIHEPKRIAYWAELPLPPEGTADDANG